MPDPHHPEEPQREPVEQHLERTKAKLGDALDQVRALVRAVKWRSKAELLAQVKTAEAWLGETITGDEPPKA